MVDSPVTGLHESGLIWSDSSGERQIWLGFVAAPVRYRRGGEQMWLALNEIGLKRRRFVAPVGAATEAHAEVWVSSDSYSALR